MAKVTFWPPATAKFMWHLMWPDTTNDPWWVKGFRYIAGWTSAAAILFGSLLGFSLAGFLIGGVMSFMWFFPPVAAAGFWMMGVFGPLMQFFGALFEIVAYVSAIFHLLALSYDLHQAHNSETSEELSETSDQVADDVERGMVAYLGTAMMFLGPYIGAKFANTRMGGWFKQFKGWWKARPAKFKAHQAAKNTPKSNTRPNPLGDEVAGGEFIGEGIRMKEQPFNQTKSGRVEQPGGQMENYKSFKETSDVPSKYREDPRFEDLSKDPAHGNKIKPETRAEATAGLEAEAQGLVEGPIERGPAEIEFYDVNGDPWDVKTPPSPKPGDRWVFNPERTGNAILKELGEKGNPPGTFPNKNTNLPSQRRVILDSTYLSPADHAALWNWLEKNLSSEQLGRIVEVNVTLVDP